MADVERIAAFQQAMALETEGKTLDAATLRQGVAAVFDGSQKGFYLVAVAGTNDDGTTEVVGSLFITYEWSDWRNATFWWIQSVYVDAGWRRRGVYRAMYDHVLSMADSPRRRLRHTALCGAHERHRPAYLRQPGYAQVALRPVTRWTSRHESGIFESWSILKSRPSRIAGSRTHISPRWRWSIKQRSTPTTPTSAASPVSAVAIRSDGDTLITTRGRDPSVVSHKYAYESAGPFGRRLRCSSSRGARHTGGFETRPYKSSRLADNQNALASS